MANLTETDLQLLMASALTDEGLLGLQLRIAKRADEIAPTEVRGMFRDIEYWLQAERDVLAGEQPRHRLAS
jgi:hypothetical protein